MLPSEQTQRGACAHAGMHVHTRARTRVRPPPLCPPPLKATKAALWLAADPSLLGSCPAPSPGGRLWHGGGRVKGAAVSGLPARRHCQRGPAAGTSAAAPPGQRASARRRAQRPRLQLEGPGGPGGCVSPCSQACRVRPVWPCCCLSVPQFPHQLRHRAARVLAPSCCAPWGPHRPAPSPPGHGAGGALSPHPSSTHGVRSLWRGREMEGVGGSHPLGISTHSGGEGLTPHPAPLQISPARRRSRLQAHKKLEQEIGAGIWRNQPQPSPPAPPGAGR